MITDKKIAKKQLEKRFNFFCESIRKRLFGGIPIDYKKILKEIPFSNELQEDKELTDIARELVLLEVKIMADLIKDRLDTKDEKLKEAIEERLKIVDISDLSLLQILDLIF